MYKQLVNTTNFCATLATNAGNTTIQLSAADCAIVEQVRLAYGGTIRILIYKPATYSSTSRYFETVLLTDTHTNNVYTVAAMTNESQYTTAQSAKISFNLMYDGLCNQWGAI